jgi:hypothetical protein
MPESKTKEKKTCQYEGYKYKCPRPLFDEKHCIFHSLDREGKKDIFRERFWQEYESQKSGKRFNFMGFIFPKGFELLGIDLQRAKLQGASFKRAKLRRAKLHGAELQGAYLVGADLRRAELKRVDLQRASLEGADLRGASFEKAIVNKVKVDRQTKFRGIDVNRAVGSPAFVRFAKDQEFLEELRETKRGERIYQAWYLFADCGRSIKRWAFWSLGFALYFGLLWLLIGGDFFYFHPEKNITWFSYFYYSIVTFTTLGFGDIVPTHWFSEFLVTLEVILGYVMLGGLISIFANKLARRS